MPTFTGCPEATQLQHHLVNNLFKDYWSQNFWIGKGFYQGLDAVPAYMHQKQRADPDQGLITVHVAGKLPTNFASVDQEDHFLDLNPPLSQMVSACAGSALKRTLNPSSWQP